MNSTKEKKTINRSLKNKITNNSSLKVNSNRSVSKGKKKPTYSDLFKEKLKYVSPDIGLSKKLDSKYSNLYKDGIKMNLDEIEKSNSNMNSLKSSIILSSSEKNIANGNNTILKISSPFKKRNLKDKILKNGNSIDNNMDNENKTIEKKNRKKSTNHLLRNRNKENGEITKSCFNSIKSDNENEEGSSNLSEQRNNKLNIFSSNEKKKQNFRKMILNEKNNSNDNISNKKLKKDKNNLFRKNSHRNKGVSLQIRKNEIKNSNKHKSTEDLIKFNGLANDESIKNENKINEIIYENKIKILKNVLNDINPSDDLQLIQSQKLLSNNPINNLHYNTFLNSNNKKCLNNLNKSLNNLFLNHTSFENYTKINKYFDKNDKDIKFLKKSNSYDFIVNYKDIETVDEILEYKIDKIFSEEIKNNLIITKYSNLIKGNKRKKTKLEKKNTNLNPYINNLNKNEKNNSKLNKNTINKDINNFNNLNDKQINCKTIENDKVLNNKNYSNLNEKENYIKKVNKNLLDIKRRKLKSFLLRNGKIIEGESSTISLIDSNRSDVNGKNLNYTNDKINILLDKIRQNSNDKNTILISYKEKYEKELEKLKKEKNELLTKKIKNYKEREEKMKKKEIIKKRENKRIYFKTYHTKTLSINVPSQTINQNEDLSFSLNKNNLKSKSDLNLLSEPFTSNKIFHFNSSEKNLKEYSENKNWTIDLENNSSLKTLNIFNINILRKSESQIINENFFSKKNINDNDKNNYLEIVKSDIKNFNKKQLKNNNSSTSLKKIKRQNFIMPVNSLDDVIEMKNFYLNIKNLNVNKNK